MWWAYLALLVEIELTDLSKSGGAMAPPAPPAPTGLNLETYGRKTLTAAPGLSEPGGRGAMPPSILRNKSTLFQPG